MEEAMCYRPALQKFAFTLAVECPDSTEQSGSNGKPKAAADTAQKTLERALSALRPSVDLMLTEAAKRTGEGKGGVKTTVTREPFAYASVGPTVGGAYWVSVSFTGSQRARSRLVNAINDVSPDNPCAGWAEETRRAGGRADVCSALLTSKTLARCSILELRALANGGDAPPPALLGQPMAKTRRVTSSSLAKIDIASFNSPLQWCAYISRGMRCCCCLCACRNNSNSLRFLLDSLQPSNPLMHHPNHKTRASRIFGGLGKFNDQSNKLKKIGARALCGQI
jgi:hypothetical protein